jgi:hypothetical protein
MRRISSRSTYAYKRIFPVFWFGFLGLVIVIPLVTAPHEDLVAIFPFAIIPLVMIFVGYFIMKKLIFDLVDEVWDDCDALVVKNSGQEQRIALADIKNVSYSPWVNPPRVTLLVRRPTVFGDQVTFCAPLRIVSFMRSPIVDDLIDRIDAARQKGA